MCRLGIPLTLPYLFPGQHKKKKLGRLEKSAATGAPRFLRGSACPPQMHNPRLGQQQGICGAVSSRAYAWVARHPMARVYGHEMGAAPTAVQPASDAGWRMARRRSMEVEWCEEPPLQPVRGANHDGGRRQRPAAHRPDLIASPWEVGPSTLPDHDSTAD